MRQLLTKNVLVLSLVLTFSSSAWAQLRVFNSVADAEALIHATAAQGGEALAQARDKATESLKVVKEKMAVAQTALTARGRIASELTSEYVRAHPREALGAAAVVGLLVGMLVTRR